MANLLISKVFLSDNIYCKFVINILSFSKLKDTLFCSTMHADFKNQTKKIWQRINSVIQSKKRKYCIFCNIWINKSEDNSTWSEILQKLILTKYDDLID